MAAQLHLRILSFAADGAASELLAQTYMDKEPGELAKLTNTNELYGIKVSCPVYRDTGPCISISDTQHGRKTCRNQPQHGTKTATLGIGHLVNRSLLLLYKTGTAGLVYRDVRDVDKQDDGAARRMFHYTALLATTEGVDGARNVKKEFTGLFVYLFVFGTFVHPVFENSHSLPV
jgi:hypothetical protein